MSEDQVAHPAIVSKDEWLAQRKVLLVKEKELTRHYDAISAERRRLPMVKIEKEYLFEGPEGKKTLLDLFDGNQQLIVYHFMFDPEWEDGCPGCTGFVDGLGDLSGLGRRNATFKLISRAPLPKLETYKAKRGWSIPWYSSYGGDFNYDFHVTLDKTMAPLEYNFLTAEELQQKNGTEAAYEGESHGLSVFFREGDDVYHTYSTYARGVEHLTDVYPLLDVTPYGRQEDWEESPAGWPQKPTYG